MAMVADVICAPQCSPERGRLNGESFRASLAAYSLAQCLLLCANPGLSALIDISQTPAADVEAFFAWLSEPPPIETCKHGFELGVGQYHQSILDTEAR